MAVDWTLFAVNAVRPLNSKLSPPTRELMWSRNPDCFGRIAVAPPVSAAVGRPARRSRPWGWTARPPSRPVLLDGPPVLLDGFLDGPVYGVGRPVLPALDGPPVLLDGFLGCTGRANRAGDGLSRAGRRIRLDGFRKIPGTACPSARWGGIHPCLDGLGVFWTAWACLDGFPAS
jgi:hypothetical protein